MQKLLPLLVTPNYLATDANDWAIDCISGPRQQALRAFSLSMDAATLTAITHDSGRDGIFATQLAMLARPGDIAIGVSATGDCASVAAGLAIRQHLLQGCAMFVFVQRFKTAADRQGPDVILLLLQTAVAGKIAHRAVQRIARFSKARVWRRARFQSRDGP